MPTVSLRIGTDKAVINNGATKPIAVASAIGKYVSPKNKLDIEHIKKAGRII